MRNYRTVQFLSHVKFAWDLDGVIGNFSPHFLSYPPLGIEDQTPATNWEDPRFRNHLHKVANDREFWESMPTIFDPRIISSFPFNTELYCTARAPEKDITRNWLWKIGAPYAPVESIGVGGDKVPVLKKYGINCYVDDSLSNFKKVNDAGIVCFLMTRSHNEGYKTDLRVDNVYQLVDAVLNKFGN